MSDSQVEKEFLKVLESNKGIIYKIANSYTFNNLDRDDLIQEVILQLWKSFDKYDDTYKHSTWIYRIALNVSISYVRKKKKKLDTETSLSSGIIFTQAIADDQKYEEDPKVVALRGFIQELNKLDRALILLFLEGTSQKEIANIMGITPTNVSTKIGRIKLKLKEKFTKLSS